MKLEKVLDELNSFEKNSFLKIIDSLISDSPKQLKQIENILSQSERELKNIDNINIAKVFNLLQIEYIQFIRSEFLNTTSQLDILIDIISKEGNAIMKLDWFSRLYEIELKKINEKVDYYKKVLEKGNKDIDDERLRDYRIYLNCLRTAYHNDELNNQEKKITSDEQSILITLSKQLDLSQEEIKFINYQIVPIKKLDIESIINELKSIGVIFYSKKQSKIYVADEVVFLLRKVRGKQVALKYFRRVLKTLREPQVNLICRKHNIDWKKDFDFKIEAIIDEGISFRSVLFEDIYRNGTTLTEKKKTVNEICDKKLKISPTIKGVVLEEKIDNLISYFEDLEKDEKVGISIEGFEKLLQDMKLLIPEFPQLIRDKYQMQEENVCNSKFLLDFNIKPRDILEIIHEEKLNYFADERQISKRGDLIDNILNDYTDVKNLLLENYENIGFRNLKALKENNISIKESDLGLTFETLTKDVFEELGFDVDEVLKSKINTKKDKIDLIINIGDQNLILIECKTVKESGYNKFSSVSRQLKSYETRINTQGYNVVKSLLVAPDFSDDFIKECGLDYELNLSLIKSSSLLAIVQGFKESKLKVFPHNLIMRDVLIEEERVLKAISR